MIVCVVGGSPPFVMSQYVVNGLLPRGQTRYRPFAAAGRAALCAAQSARQAEGADVLGATGVVHGNGIAWQTHAVGDPEVAEANAADSKRQEEGWLK